MVIDAASPLLDAGTSKSASTCATMRAACGRVRRFVVEAGREAGDDLVAGARPFAQDAKGRARLTAGERSPLVGADCRGLPSVVTEASFGVLPRKEWAAVRVLFADDQLPDEAIPSNQVFDSIRRRYPEAQEGFIRAFEVMRRARQAVAEDNSVAVANRFDKALEMIRSQAFDVVLIDLGWYADPSVPEVEQPTAGWHLAEAVDAEDELHPERPRTAQVIYSARFDSQPELAQKAAAKGRLPLVKPYAERWTLPLQDSTRMAQATDRVEASCQSLCAVLAFIERVRSQALAGPDVDRDTRLRLKAVVDGIARANERERHWDRLTRWTLGLALLVMLSGVVSMFFFGLAEGVVTAAVGVVVGLIPRLLYGELSKVRQEIQRAEEKMEFAFQAEARGAPRERHSH